MAVHARLRALNGTSDSLLRVLAEASAVGDILAVQNNLGSVQSEIEQLQGRQRVLDDQIALATIAVSLQEPGPDSAPAEPEAERSSWQRAVDGFNGTWSSLLAHSGAALAVVSMAALALAVIIGLVRRGRRAYARWVA